MPKAQHRHLSARILERQVVYGKSQASFESAKAIVKTKLRNCRLLLSGFCQSRKRAGYANAQTLQKYQMQIRRIERTMQQAQDRPAVFRLEAQASRIYWKAVALLCHQHSLWQRVYPHAKDPLNIVLNTGYIGLARQVMKKIEVAGLVPELGMFHGANSGDALVYDVMECFREPAVDGAIIPLFSRKRKNALRLSEKDLKKGFWLLSKRFDKRYPYKGRCEKLERIILLEVMKLKRCIIENTIWEPYTHRWGHNWKCPER